MATHRNPSVFVGVDGCKGGWLAVTLEGKAKWNVQVFPDISSLWDQRRQAELILIDIPIGLQDSGSEERLCDTEARKLLKWPRRTSVFPVPCRAAVHAADDEEAKAVNVQKTDRSLSAQTLAIRRKISEVDTFLEENAQARGRIREVHPEICFWALNGGRPMKFGKKEPKGLEKRMNVLRQVCDQTDSILEFARREFRGRVADDDVLDALAAAVTAFLGKGRGLTLPAAPEVDSTGLPMEMAYYPMP